MRRAVSIGGLILTAMSAVTAVAQQAGQEGAAAGPSAEVVSTCTDAQQRALRLLDAIDERVESSRQSNSPAAMRAAMADLQRGLLEARTELGRCAALVSTAAPTEPHAGHSTPTTPPTAGPTPKVGAANDPSAGRQAGEADLNIAFRSVPDPMRAAADNEFEVVVTDRPGRPVERASVSLLFYMPAMPSMKMPEMRSEVKLAAAGNGTYTGRGQVMMAGQWTVTVSVEKNGKEIGRKSLAATAR
jgi:hypothetical protein